jgi:hypothetical protein
MIIGMKYFDSLAIFSSSPDFNHRLELAISVVPVKRADIPVDEPAPSNVISTSGIASFSCSIHSCATGKRVFDPLITSFADNPVIQSNNNEITVINFDISKPPQFFYGYRLPYGFFRFFKDCKEV